jgi:hypothetical protein
LHTGEDGLLVNTTRNAEKRKIMIYRAEGNVCCKDKKDYKNESRWTEKNDK